MSMLALIYHIAVLLALLGALAMVVMNLACFDGLRDGGRFGPDAPMVSILVPARNEALNIEACVRSLLAQEYPNWELLALDDHSEDETGAIIRVLGVSETGERARLLSGAALPAGWTGKNWACYQLAQQARGRFLFFTDADTTHAPGTVRAAVDYALRTRADLVSAWPRQVTETWSEKLIIPMIVLGGMTLYPHWLVILLQRFPMLSVLIPQKIRGALGAANGQFMFFTREGYDRIGGHAALRDHMVEDVMLGRAVAARSREGMRLCNCESLAFSTCRMYRSFNEVWEGFTKNLRSAFEDPVGFLIIGTMQFCCFLLPCLLLFLPVAGKGWIVAQVALIYLIRLILTVRFRTSWLGMVLHPIGFALALAIGGNSWRKSARGGVTWKGRTYEIGAGSRE
jgi:chlorobactene glucosyltransferase